MDNKEPTFIAPDGSFWTSERDWAISTGQKTNIANNTDIKYQAPDGTWWSNYDEYVQFTQAIEMEETKKQR